MSAHGGSHTQTHGHHSSYRRHNSTQQSVSHNTIDPELERIVKKFVLTGRYARGVKPILKGAVVPGQKAFKFVPMDRLTPLQLESWEENTLRDEHVCQNPTWVNRWLRVFGTVPSLDSSFLDHLATACKISSNEDQPEARLHHKETYLDIRNEQDRRTSVERVLAGIACVQRGQMEMALEHYSHAINHDPSSAGAFLSRGCTLGNMSRWQEAAEDFRSALVINPTDGAAQQYLAKALECVNAATWNGGPRENFILAATATAPPAPPAPPIKPVDPRTLAVPSVPTAPPAPPLPPVPPVPPVPP
ncbi:hypothetical protein BGZ83_003246, partial [Gryganskiella cystojenkinii]